MIKIDRINKDFTIQRFADQILTRHEVHPVKCVWEWLKAIIHYKKPETEDNIVLLTNLLDKILASYQTTVSESDFEYFYGIKCL